MIDPITGNNLYSFDTAPEKTINPQNKKKRLKQ